MTGQSRAIFIFFFDKKERRKKRKKKEKKKKKKEKPFENKNTQFFNLKVSFFHSYELNHVYDDTFSLQSSLKHEGLRVCIRDYFEFMEEKEGLDVGKIWERIHTTLALAFSAGESEVTKACSSLVKQRFVF